MLNLSTKACVGAVEMFRKSLEKTFKLSTSSTEGLLKISQSTTHLPSLVAVWPQPSDFSTQVRNSYFKWWGLDFCSFSPTPNNKNVLIKDLYL